jgi:hypothetical protein
VDGGVVELVVEDGSPPIFYCILDSRYDENDDERYGVKGRVTSTENGENLEKSVS